MLKQAPSDKYDMPNVVAKWKCFFSISTLNHPKKRFFIVPKSSRYALQLFSGKHNNALKGNVDNRRRRLLVEPLHARVLWLPHFDLNVFFIVFDLPDSWNKFVSTHFIFFMCWNIEDNTLGMLPWGFDGRAKEGRSWGCSKGRTGNSTFIERSSLEPIIL
ncbi:hypothetical protein JHK82_043179 [Glycine max]|nr:hypothetical protein JHK85_043851 [Glycine max]KAG5106209.1 hypothetical protein JHK82_043179 [Glycine max]